MLFITHIRMSQGGHRHEHITEVKWFNNENNQTGVSTRGQVVDWLNLGNHAYVTDGQHTVEVRVVNANPPYLQTYADGIWTDNLLALPRF